VYLSGQAIFLFRELEVLASGSELVLPGRGSMTKPFALNGLKQALKIALKGEDIPAFTVHDLRRTASTLLHENGWPSDVVEKALNHTTGEVRGIYNRAKYAEQRREMLRRSCYFDKASRRQLLAYAGPLSRAIEQCLDYYAIVGDDRRVITVAPRIKRIRHQAVSGSCAQRAGAARVATGQTCQHVSASFVGLESSSTPGCVARRFYAAFWALTIFD
jgi:hypothetical protein